MEHKISIELQDYLNWEKILSCIDESEEDLIDLIRNTMDNFWWDLSKEDKDYLNNR